MLDAAAPPDPIEAERLTLRPPRPEDAGVISLNLGDARVARMLANVPHPYPPGAAEALIERALAGRRSGPLWVMDASRSGGPDVVGLVLVARGEGEGVFAVSFAVWPPFRKHGHATEALRAVAGRLFEQGAEALTAVVFHDEQAAHVLTRAGFDWTGDGEAFCTARGAVAPAWRYRLERAKWSPSAPRA